MLRFFHTFHDKVIKYCDITVSNTVPFQGVKLSEYYLLLADIQITVLEFYIGMGQNYNAAIDSCNYHWTWLACDDMEAPM